MQPLKIQKILNREILREGGRDKLGLGIYLPDGLFGGGSW